jgi:hypothetical protein
MTAITNAAPTITRLSGLGASPCAASAIPAPIHIMTKKTNDPKELFVLMAITSSD